MLLYMGNGAAWAAYDRERRARRLTECAAACGAAFDDMSKRLGEAPDDEERGRLAPGLASTRDCMELCAAAAPLMARGGGLSRLAAAPCAEACRLCAEACDALSPIDGAAECARLCRRSAEICRHWPGL
jgi:hypothetical protein